MNSPCYDVLPSDEYLSYTFWSIGPKGKILKSIRYSLFQTQPIVVFNLGLADIDVQANTSRDDVISNNGDRDKILMTVVESIKIFFQRYPEAYVYAAGNSPQETGCIK